MTDIRQPIFGVRIRAISRALRAAPAIRHDMKERTARQAPFRQRRGAVGVIPATWRRRAAGHNRISCLGVWRTGMRREAIRTNRLGATDWHRPWRLHDQVYAALDRVRSNLKAHDGDRR